MTLRRDFVTLAQQEGANMAELCRRFAISRKTGYKWLRRYRAGGAAALADQVRRPHTSPRRTAPAVEQAILTLRQEHPTWGGRKLARRLHTLEQPDVPVASTITAILRRHDQLDPAVSAQHQPLQRFEAAQPNELWQMDFKGHFPLGQGRCHPLTVLDDHSRFALGVVACPDERTQTVQAHLTAIFRRYGLPQRLLVDNGSPWGSSSLEALTACAVWLLRLGIQLSHGAPYHPQTQGKAERFNQTLQLELLGQQVWTDLATCQRRFDRWRDIYNYERPHEALGLAVPTSRYQSSPRPFPESLPPLVYGAQDQVRTVQQRGEIWFHNREWWIGKGLAGQRVALRPTTTDGVYQVVFCQTQVATIDLRPAPPV